MKITLEITQKDIDQAIQNSKDDNFDIICGCIIAQAIMRQLKINYVRVFSTSVKIDKNYLYPLEEDKFKEITKIHPPKWNTVKPTSLELLNK